MATQKAHELRKPILAALDGLKSLTDSRKFDPASEHLEFSVAANDFQRSLIFPELIQTLAKKSINARFRFLPSGIPDATILRRDHCDVLISPFPPDGTDIIQTRLFSDELMCFFDGAVIDPPATLKEFLDANHLDVTFEDHGSVMQRLMPSEIVAKLPSPKVSVPNFGAVSEFISNTDMITVQMGKMSRTSLKDVDCASLPFKTAPLNLYMVWYRRYNNDPAHIWLRELIKQHVK